MADTQMDLEDWLSQSARVERDYKRPGTSSRAAAYAARFASGTFAKIRTALLYGEFTPEEIAERINVHPLTVKPRCSDLRKPRDGDGRLIAPFVVPTGKTRPTECGRDADVLRLATPLERREWRP